MKNLAVRFFIFLAILTNQPCFAAKVTDFFGSLVHEFDEQEPCLRNIEQARELFSSLSEKLPPHSPQQMNTAFRYALSKINQSAASAYAKHQMHLIVADLAFGKQLSDVWNTLDEEEIPASLLLGGVEILVGSLIHIIPGCGWLGKLIIADGIRRGFNGLEEMNNNVS